MALFSGSPGTRDAGSMQVFVSHSHEDEAAYSSLCLALDGSGVSRWDVSKLSAGRPLADGLRAAIEQCDLCIFLATPRSLESRWCLAELGAFWGAGKKVVIYVADPTISESELPPQFLGNLWIQDATRLIENVKKADHGRIHKTESGYCTDLGGMTINLILGRIEETLSVNEDCLIALPANEFFDDDCIHDNRSALGAFVQHHFAGNVPGIQALVKNALDNEPHEEVEKRPGEVARSYGVGKCVFLRRPLESNFQIAMVSVTTQRADVGLRAHVAYVFQGGRSPATGDGK